VCELLHLDELHLDVWRVYWTNVSEDGYECFAGNGELAVTADVFVTTSTSTTLSMSRLYLWW
jgi:hypothetical protein